MKASITWITPSKVRCLHADLETEANCLVWFDLVTRWIGNKRTIYKVTIDDRVLFQSEG